MLFKEKPTKELDDFYISHIKYKDDCRKIKKSFASKGIDLTLLECQEIYKNYSYETWCASWECGVEDMSFNNLYNILKPHLNEMIEDKCKRLFEVIGMIEKKTI